MNRAWLLLLLGAFFACGGVQQIRTDLYIPHPPSQEGVDSIYMEAWQDLKQGYADIAYEKFKKSTSSDELLYVGFGYCYLAQDNLVMAERNFRQCLEINPDNINAGLGIAEVLEARGDIDLAFQYYSRLRVLNPDHAWIKVRHEKIKSIQTELYLRQAEDLKGQEDETYINSLKKAAQYSPEIVGIKIKIADYYFRQGQFDQAAGQYEDILKKNPNNEEIMLKLASVYENLNKLDAAVLIYNKLLLLKPGNMIIVNKINELKVKFYNLDLPSKFKNIFFKDSINREELAALIGHYFKDYLVDKSPPIITDLGESFAKEAIIKVCALGIMKVGANHRFYRYQTLTRSEFAVVVYTLIKYLDRIGVVIKYTPVETTLEPFDIPQTHKSYEIFKFLINAQIMDIDGDNNFNPTRDISPSEVLNAMRKLITSIKRIEE